MPDFSTELFSIENQEPTLLPTRFRLCNNLTRYSYDVTLEELNTLGYIGPIELPEHADNEHLEWDSCGCCYNVVSGVCLDKKVCPKENKKARDILNDRILEVKTTDTLLLYMTDEYVKEYSIYKGKLLDLICKRELDFITCQDIPPIPLIHGGVKKEYEEDKKRKEEEKIAGYREQYERYGFIVDSLLDDYFVYEPHSDWIPGNETLPESFYESVIIEKEKKAL